MKLEYYSDVKDGKLQKGVSERIAKELKTFEGKKIVLKIEKAKSIRSLQQNRYWWACITIIAKELGYDKNDVHELLKFKFLKREKVIEATGEILPYIESTTKLNKSEFADMTSDLIRWAAETLNIILPVPGEQTQFFDENNT